MFDKIIRVAFIAAVAFALFASCTTRAHAEVSCLKPPAAVAVKHHKHKLRKRPIPIASCVDSPPLVFWQSLPDPLPITVATRYVDASVPLPADIVPTPYIWQPRVSSDAWITPFIGGGMSFGSYTGGARTYTYNSYATSTINQVNQSTSVAVAIAIAQTIITNVNTSVVINKPPAHESWHHAKAAPEISGEGAAGAVTLLAGILLVIRSGKRGIANG